MEGTPQKKEQNRSIGQYAAALGVIAFCILLSGNIILARTIITGTPITLPYAVSTYSATLPTFSFSAQELASLIFSYRSASTASKEVHHDPLHILILGLPGEGNPAPHLADTVMVLRVNPAPRSPDVKLISIPRDLYISLDGQHIRINALWRHATQSYDDPVAHTKQTVERIIGIPLTHIVVFDLATVHRIVEHVDGVTVTIESDVYDPRFPVDRGRYETFELVGGSRYLNADDALRFIRTRASPRGDFDRMHRQQLFIQALKGKIASLNPVWNFRTLWRMYTTVKDEVITDITFEDAQILWQTSHRVPFGSVDTLVIDEVSGLVRPHTVRSGGIPASVLVADQQDMFDYTRIQEAVTAFLKQ